MNPVSDGVSNEFNNIRVSESNLVTTEQNENSLKDIINKFESKIKNNIQRGNLKNFEQGGTNFFSKERCSNITNNNLTQRELSFKVKNNNQMSQETNFVGKCVKKLNSENLEEKHFNAGKNEEPGDNKENEFSWESTGAISKKYTPKSSSQKEASSILTCIDLNKQNQNKKKKSEKLENNRIEEKNKTKDSTEESSIER